MDYSSAVVGNCILRKIFLYIVILGMSFVACACAFDGADKVFDDLLPDLLSKTSTTEDDLQLYRRIFSFIHSGKMQEADKSIAKLKNNSLRGHFLAEKYLRQKNQTTYKELQQWLSKYSDLPQKDAIKALSITKAPGYKPSKPKQEVKKIYASYDWYKDDYAKLKPEDRKFVRQKIGEFLRAIRRTDNTEATKIMQDEKFRKTIPDKRYDGMSATLASSYFYDGDYDSALKWTTKAIKRSNEPTAAWFGGLAAWKLGDYEKAAELFEKVKDNDQWLMAAASFWAYRAYTKLDKKHKAKRCLHRAANYKRTFYGILAKSQLGEKIEYDWSKKSYLVNIKKDKDWQELLKSKVAQRVLLLIKIGETDLAERDLRKNYSTLNAKQKELAMFLSEHYNFANLSFVLADSLENIGKKREYNAFMYPYPNWEPQKGWKVNPSWVFALIRQESLFMDRVKSPAGACGLMQLMPTTAAIVAKNKEYAKGCNELFDKSLNLQIGQDYVKMLLDDKNVGDNMFFLAASYNAGPHSVKKWFNRKNFDDDPLMFAEMIPWRETRLYVKKVAANYWIYNSRRNKNSKSLKQLSKGKWPSLD